MEYRIERDSMGEVQVPADRYWAAQTQRSYQNFKIGEEKMPKEIVHAFGILKKAAAVANHRLNPERMDAQRLSAICAACDEVIAGRLNDHFPLVVWQTGSGTQSNMNANEVIANRGNELVGKKILHPNDHVNMSQSSNDTFPTAMHIAAVLGIEDRLMPEMARMNETLKRLEAENDDCVKSGRTHLQDATPIKFSQEISGWRSMIEKTMEMLRAALPGLKELALGGTAVGTGLNCPKGFDAEVAKAVSEETGKSFVTAPNKFHSLTSKDDLVFAHGALKALAANLKEIAPYIELETHTLRITEDNIGELLTDADIICEAFDNPECKAMLVNAVLEKFPEKYLLSGSGMAGMDSVNRIQTRRVTKRFYLCGDGVSDVKECGTLVSSRVMTCAAHEAHMVIRILAGEPEP